MAKQKQPPPKPAETPQKNNLDEIHWCGHKIKDHTGEDGMCKYNTEISDACDCGGLDE